MKSKTPLKTNVREVSESQDDEIFAHDDGNEGPQEHHFHMPKKSLSGVSASALAADMQPVTASAKKFDSPEHQ